VAVAVGDVFADRAVEQKHVLVDDADQVAVAGDVDLGHVGAVEQDAAAGGIVEPGDQVAERGLAAAAGADERDRFAGLNVEINVVECVVAGAGVGETHAVECHATGDRGFFDADFAGVGFGRFVEQVENAVES
jgi:hypothetical protein